MSVPNSSVLLSRYMMAAMMVTVVVASNQLASAGDFLNRRNVGGISIDANGVVAQPTAADRVALKRQELKALADRPVPKAMNEGVELRMISLRGLQAAVSDALQNNAGKIPAEVRYLAGLQRIQYVLVYPEDNDIVLAGPAEGWKVNDVGAVVGVSTGRPVMRLDDLVVALRAVDEVRTTGITCSIDPTQEGRQRFSAFMKRQRAFSPAVVKDIEKALGAQRVTLTGVAPTSHFARVMVAADVRMKRLAMALDKAPVDDLPNFLSLMNSSGVRITNMTPRWWLASDYEPMGRGENGLVWEIRGDGVKAMTEDDFIQQDGTVKETNRKNPIAQKWADAFNKKYAELSTKATVFGELRNCMDLCVAAALIRQHDLLGRSGLDLSLLTKNDSVYTLGNWPAPKTISTQCSFVKSGREWIITASGGVEVESWQVVQKTVPAEGADRLRTKAMGVKGHRWWWN